MRRILAHLVDQVSVDKFITLALKRAKLQQAIKLTSCEPFMPWSFFLVRKWIYRSDHSSNLHL